MLSELKVMIIDLNLLCDAIVGPLLFLKHALPLVLFLLTAPDTPLWFHGYHAVLIK